MEYTLPRYSMRMVASIPSRYRITTRAVTSDCTALAAMKSRPDSGSMRAQCLAPGRGQSAHTGTISPVVASCTWLSDCRVMRWRSGPLRMSHPQPDAVEVQQPVDGGVAGKRDARHHPFPVLVQIPHDQQHRCPYRVREYQLAFGILPGHWPVQVLAGVIHRRGEHGLQLGVQLGVCLQIQTQVRLYIFQGDHRGTHDSLTAQGLGCP